MAKPTRLRLVLPVFLAILSFTGIAAAQGNRKVEHVLIETTKPYDRVINAIQSQGGKVTHQFSYVDGIAADLPIDKLDAIRTLVGPTSMSKDVNIPAPGSVGAGGSRTVRGKQIGPVTLSNTKSRTAIASSALADFAAKHPEAYSLNNAGTRVDKLHAKGYTGQGTIVAVIDSGYRPGFTYLDGDSSLLAGRDFVGDGNGYSNINNDGHGTFAAGLISGHGTFTLSDLMHDAVKAYAPDALDPKTGDLSLIGTAPSAKIYAVRVFGADAAAGAPLSRILDAIQHVIDVRTDYDKSRGAKGYRIDVCNLSLGVSTIEAGRSMLDRSVDALLAAGIIPVISAGNTGPSSLTIASPGSSMSALTVGGTSRAANERIQIDVADATLGDGALYRPSPGTQTAWFSSRGPNADGRLDPDVVVSGVGNIAQGYCPDQTSIPYCDGNLSIASGTSFSAPIVAGIAAILRQAFPKASPIEIRNAIVSTANSSLLADGSTILDRGQGMPDALAAYNLLASGKASDYMPRPGQPDDDVQRNVERNTDLNVYSGNVRLNARNLKPGQRYDVLYKVDPGTESVVVSFNNVNFSLPADQQNAFFLDDLYVHIHSAKTSSIGANGDYAVGFYADQPPYVYGDQQFTVDDPDTGIMRITMMGDETNAGTVSATVNIHSVHESLPRVTASGIIKDKKTKTIPIKIPAGVQEADFLLSWENDWGHYPTSDLDMTIIDPDGNVLVDETGAQPGATLAGPERATVLAPKKGTWQVVVDGFDIPANTDNYQLRVTLDGKILK